MQIAKASCKVRTTMSKYCILFLLSCGLCLTGCYSSRYAQDEKAVQAKGQYWRLSIDSQLSDYVEERIELNSYGEARVEWIYGASYSRGPIKCFGYIRDEGLLLDIRSLVIENAGSFSRFSSAPETSATKISFMDSSGVEQVFAWDESLRRHYSMPQTNEDPLPEVELIRRWFVLRDLVAGVAARAVDSDGIAIQNFFER